MMAHISYNGVPLDQIIEESDHLREQLAAVMKERDDLLIMPMSAEGLRAEKYKAKLAAMTKECDQYKHVSEKYYELWKENSNSLAEVKNERDEKDRQVASLYDKYAGYEALCQKYQKALAMVWKTHSITGEANVLIMEALATPSPTAALNAAIADELERLIDEIDPTWEGLDALRTRAKELKEMK